MQKILTLGLIGTFTILLLSACTSYKPNRSYMTPEQVQQEQQKLDEAMQQYESAEDDTAKIEAIASVGFHYMTLGDYDKAIKSYKDVLKLDPSHFPALNNLAVMYEEMGDLDNAIKYLSELYNRYTDNAEVNSDFIRVLLANNQFDEATRVLEAYKLTEKAAGNEEFIKSLEKSIEDARQKAGQ